MSVPAPDDSNGFIAGGGGGGASSGGGVPGTPTSTVVPVANIPFSENGGVVGSTFYLFVPVQDLNSGRFYFGTFDPSSGNDPVDGSYYTYRSEDIIRNSVVTVNRLVVIYRDLGLVKVNFQVSGTNDDGLAIVQQVTKQLGNAIPTGILYTAFIDIQLTCFRPTVTVVRAAGSGPLCITSLSMRGEAEEQ